MPRLDANQFAYIYKIAKALFTIRRHQSAGSNAAPWRILRNALPYYFNRQGRAFHPLSLFFIINSRCNFKCQFCDVGQRNTESMFYRNLISQGAPDFPIARFKSLIDEVKFFKPFISITSTEPLLYKPLVEAIAYARTAGLEVNITTNGFLLEQFAEDFVKVGLTSLCVSLDGPPAIHDAMRGVPGAFERARRGLQRIADEKQRRARAYPILAVNSVVSDANQAQLVSLMEHLPLDILAQVGMMSMVFLPAALAQTHNAVWGAKYPATEACLAGGATPTHIDPHLLSQQLQEIQRRYRQKVVFHLGLEEDWLAKYFTRPDEFMDATKCVFPWFSAQITACGDLVGLTRCYPMALGNILETPFLDVWNGPKMREFRQDLRKYGRFPACPRCEGVLYR